MMLDKQSLIALIQQAFQETEHPGDAFLQGSDEGCEPAEVTAPFKGGRHWSQMDPALLDPNYTALSFFSEGGVPSFSAGLFDGRCERSVADSGSGVPSH